jgi:putative membrane protein
MDGAWFGWFFWVAVVVLIVWAIVNQNKKQIYPPQQHETPLDIIKKRYAKGEITKELFEEMKNTLEK